MQSAFRLLLACSAVLSARVLDAQIVSFTTPNVVNDTGAVSSLLGETRFINHGLVGIGRVSGSILDAFGDTFGSVSGMHLTNWTRTESGTYSGIFNTLPDRGYNTTTGNIFNSDYAARIQQLAFTFSPYYGAENIGGTNIEEKLAAQNQIALTYLGAQRLTYSDPITGNASSFTTGLDPGPSAAQTTIFGTTVPWVNKDGDRDVKKLTLDSEALVLLPDGSGYIGDEYGANIYHFNAQKQIDGVIVATEAGRPHLPVGTPNYTSLQAPVNGRRNNQGFEGVSVSPDGKKLFALLQSATIQDTNGTQQQTRNNTRLFVYDLSEQAIPTAPVAEYVIQLPIYRSNGDGAAADRTAAQSEIVALDDHRLLVLARDSNGLGAATAVRSMYKSVLLVDLSVGSPTNIVGDAARNAEGGTIATAGLLDPSITPLSWVEAINMLNASQLEKFNAKLDAGGASQVDKLVLSEKWEGMSLVPALDPERPNDYFLFLANDNDFLTSQGQMRQSDGQMQSYNSFNNGYAANRVPAPVGSSTTSENDTVFHAYRVTIEPVPEPGSALLFAASAGALLLRRRRRS